jgi:transposase
MRSVGLDLGARKIAFCEVSEGAVVRRATVTRVEELEPLVGPGTSAANVAIEASGEAWHVHATLTEWGHTAHLVDTTRVKSIGVGQHGRKNDRLDAEALARAMEDGKIPRAHLLSPARRELRRHLHVRRTLIETRTTFIVGLRAMFRSEGVPLPRCDSERFVAMMRERELPESLRRVAEPIVATLETLQRQLAEADRRLVELYAAEPTVQLLSTTPGVGLIVAAMFVAVIDEARRFKHAHELESYLGLVPTEKSSGTTGRRLGSITKKGNAYLRSLLVQAAWQVLRRKDDADPLVLWGRAVLERRGKRIAMIAVARRLAGILWAMWKRGKAYDPAHAARASARGLDAAGETTKQRARAMRAAAEKVEAGVARAERGAAAPARKLSRRTKSLHA